MARCCSRARTQAAILWETQLACGRRTGLLLVRMKLLGFSGAFAGGIFHGFNSDLVVFNNEVLFDGLDASNQTNLWVTNGTAAGPYELTGISGAYTGSGGLFGANTPLTGLGG